MITIRNILRIQQKLSNFGKLRFLFYYDLCTVKKFIC